MTKCHWSGNTNSFPLPSIFTTSVFSPAAYVLSWLETTPPAGYSAADDPALTAPLTAFIWPSLQPVDPVSDHYTPLYTNAAWVQMKSNTSVDPFRPSSSGSLCWPPRSLDSASDFSPSVDEISPCERAAAARISLPTAPHLKRKRSVDDCGGLERSAQRLRLDSPPVSTITPKVAEFLASIKVSPHSGTRVYLRPVRRSGP